MESNSRAVVKWLLTQLQQKNWAPASGSDSGGRCAGAFERPWLRSPLADMARGPADGAGGNDADLPVHRDFMQLPEERAGLQRNPSISSALRESGEGALQDLRAFASDASFSIGRLLEVWPSIRSGLGMAGCLLDGLTPLEEVQGSPTSLAPAQAMGSPSLCCSMPMGACSQGHPSVAGSPQAALPPLLRRSGFSLLPSPAAKGIVNSSLVGESPGGEPPGERSPQDAQSHCAIASAPPGAMPFPALFVPGYASCVTIPRFSVSYAM